MKFPTFFRLFERSPKAKAVFGFPKDLTNDLDELKLNRRFVMHASYMIRMLDTAFQLLGPDQQLLSEIMADLGARHAKAGVEDDMFLVMEEALIATLKEILSEDAFGSKESLAFRETYSVLAFAMRQSK